MHDEDDGFKVAKLGLVLTESMLGLNGSKLTTPELLLKYLAYLDMMVAWWNNCAA